jgi:hypothetical protein
MTRRIIRYCTPTRPASIARTTNGIHPNSIRPVQSIRLDSRHDGSIGFLDIQRTRRHGSPERQQDKCSTTRPGFPRTM